MPPTVMAAMSPTHLLGRETIHLVSAGDGGMRIGISGRPKAVISERLRQQRRGLRAGGQRSRARGKSKGEFQKMAAFHDVSLLLHVP